MGPIKVAIADDHKIFRKGVILSLRPYPNIKFVLEAENGQELLDNSAYFLQKQIRPMLFLWIFECLQKMASKPPK